MGTEALGRVWPWKECLSVWRAGGRCRCCALRCEDFLRRQSQVFCFSVVLKPMK